jgi:hypothetical protein
MLVYTYIHISYMHIYIYLEIERVKLGHNKVEAPSFRLVSSLPYPQILDQPENVTKSFTL